MKDKNPHHLCTWDAAADCGACGLDSRLACTWDGRLLKAFWATFSPTLIVSIAGMVVIGKTAGTWWPLLGYLAYLIVLLGVFEIRFLCSHCPYYAEEGRILHCLGNHGSFKFWKYHPEPMNGFERFMMLFLVATAFGLVPLVIEACGFSFLAAHRDTYGAAMLWAFGGIIATTLVTAVSALTILRAFFCSSCVNFSCPLNTVPKRTVDAYLGRNPVMREAWVASGWKLGGDGE